LGSRETIEEPDEAYLVGKARSVMRTPALAEGFFEVKHTVEVGGTRTFANFRYLHPEDERVLDMDLEPPVTGEKQTLLSKLRSAKNGAALNGEESELVMLKRR